MTDEEYARYASGQYDRFVSFVLREVGEAHAAADIVQDALMRLWIRRDRIDSSSPEGYFITTLRNGVNDHFRRAWQRRLTLSDFADEADIRSLIDPHDRIAELIAAEELQWQQRALSRALPRLPQEERDVLELTLAGLKPDEIASRLKIDRATVYRRLSQAKSTLARLVNPGG